MAKRLSDRAKIDDLISRIAALPLVMGGNDCAGGLVFPIVEIQTGKDLWAPYRGRYTTFLEGVKLLKADGFANLEELVAHHFKPRRAVAFAQYGDVVSLPCEHDGFALGILRGDHIVAMTETGIVTAPRSTSKLAFAIE